MCINLAVAVNVKKTSVLMFTYSFQLLHRTALLVMGLLDYPYQSTFYIRLCSDVHEKNQNYFVIKDITVTMMTFIR